MSSSRLVWVRLVVTGPVFGGGDLLVPLQVHELCDVLFRRITPLMRRIVQLRLGIAAETMQEGIVVLGTLPRLLEGLDDGHLLRLNLRLQLVEINCGESVKGVLRADVCVFHVHVHLLGYFFLVEAAAMRAAF